MILNGHETLIVSFTSRAHFSVHKQRQRGNGQVTSQLVAPGLSVLSWLPGGLMVATSAIRTTRHQMSQLIAAAPKDIAVIGLFQISAQAFYYCKPP